MKKAISFIGGMFFTLLFAVNTWGATREIPVNQVSGSANSLAANPVQYIVDGRLDTVWRLDSQSGYGWAELRLADKVLIDGIQLYGTYRGLLTVEYWQDKGWHAFLGARDLDGSLSHSGWNLLDLSYDRVASDRIRLWFSGTGAGPIGGIGEVRALGRRTEELVRRIEPQTVTSADRFQNGLWRQDRNPAEYLFDHNTNTGWEIHAAAPGASRAVDVDLGAECAIDRIKLFNGYPQEPLYSKGVFTKTSRVTIQYQSQGLWRDIPGLSNVDLSRLGTGWRSFELAAGAIQTHKLRIALLGEERLGVLKEVEIWGRNVTELGSIYLDCGGAPQQLTASGAGNYGFTFTQPAAGTINLHLAATGDPANSLLRWELNGRNMGELKAAVRVHGGFLYRSLIAPEDLRIGPNFIRVQGTGLTVQDCRIEISGETGLAVADGAGLTDRLLLTPAGENETLDFGGTFHLDELRLNYLGAFFSPEVWVEQDHRWVKLPSPRNEPGAVGGTLIYERPGAVTGIRVSSNLTDAASDSNDGSSGLTELEWIGSGVNQGPPRVRILGPADGALLSLKEWAQTKLTGTVDNPEAEVRVNGRKISLEGTGFEVPLAGFGADGEIRTLEVVATDAEGRRGVDQITVGVGFPFGVTLNLPERITYTRESQITVSGQVWSNNCRIFVNGEEISVGNKAFTKVVALAEGYNSILVKAVYGNSKFSVLKLREVVRTSAAPYLRILAPVSGQITSEEAVVVSGKVSSLQPVTVKVNGQTSVVENGSFYSLPVSLKEGENRITVSATDQTGQMSRQELVVYRDRVAPSLEGILPVDGAMFNTTTVTVSGQVRDASPVSVMVNGAAADISVGANGGSPQTWTITINLAEGWNDIKIEARDTAGNATTITRRVLVDLKPPAAFTPVVNPEGWSKNNRPTITFGTTDAESGIDHYEIAVGGDAWTTPVVSPYQFPLALPDGEPTIRVKAVDKAGNETVGEAKAYIDTTPPGIPEEFEVIPGIGRVTLKWKDATGDVVGYRIERSPAFEGERFRELRRTKDVFQINEYIDSEVSPGLQYTYTLQAIDRVENYGTKTAPVKVAVGSGTSNINSEGGNVKFDICTVNLAQGAVAESGKVVITKTQEAVAENNYAAPVSVAYNITLYNEAGVEIAPQFNGPVTLTMSYAGLVLPEGFDPGDLGIYWYNQEGGYWEKLEHVGLDFGAQTLTATLNHFSDYQMMASKYVSPSLASYYDLGVSPFGSYFQDNLESISSASGSLTVSATDLKLPGRNGFDLILKRVYDSGAAQQEKIIECNGESWRKTPVDTFGYGWSLNIPWIEETDKGKFIRLPEGQTIKIELSNISFDYHEGIHFTLYSLQTLIMKDGTIFNFDTSGRVTSQTDPSGINTIYYEYDPVYTRQLKRIIDSAGREVLFTYKQAGNKYVIASIATGTGIVRTWKYNYSDKSVLREAIDPKNRVTVYNYEEKTGCESGFSANWSRSIHQWVTVEGETKFYGDSGNGSTNKIFSYDLNILKSITYPTGAVSVYEYTLRDQGGHEDWDDPSHSEIRDTCFVPYKEVDEEGNEHLKYRIADRLTVTDKTDNGSITLAGCRVFYLSQTILDKVVKYDYTLNPASGSLRSNNYIQAGSYILACKITEGKKSGSQFESARATQETYKLLFETTLGNWPINVEQSKNYEGSLLVSRLVSTTGASVAQLTTYEYDLKLRAVTKEQQRRGSPATVAKSEPIYENIINYDGWGNPTYRLDGSRKLEETWTYYTREFLVGGNNYRVSYAVQSQLKKNWNPLTSSYSPTITTTYQYQEYWKPDLITVVSGSLQQETRYEYYLSGPEKGAVWKTTAPNGLVTEYAYDSQGLPIRQTRSGVENADKSLAAGSPNYSAGTIVIQTHYNPDTGMKDSEKDARGFETRYEYDKLNRVTRVTLPDGGGTREYVFYDAPGDLKFNTCEYYNENRQLTWFKFDGLGRLTEIVKDPQGLNIRTVYHYDALGRIDKVTDPLGRVTTYEYDGFNRVIKITFPKSNPGDSQNPFASLEYDDLTNTVTITDENGGKTIEQSDWANRLIAAQQQCEFPGEATQLYHWSFKYDSLGNKVQQMDPLTNQSNQIFDELGRLKEVRLSEIMVTASGDQAPQAKTPVMKYGYDPMGNKTSETDARGNTVKYDYDLIGRLVTVTTTSTRIKDLKTGATETVTAVTRNYYDAAGNKIQTTDANNHNWYYTYSAQGFLLSEQDPEGNLVQYRYDPMGNKIAVIDPRNQEVSRDTWYTMVNQKPVISDPRSNKSFTTWFVYDNLGRLAKTILPDGTPPVNPYTAEEDNPFTAITYNSDGNKATERDATGLVTSYTYTPRGWVESVSMGGQLKVKYIYDAKGNPKEIRGYLDVSNYTSTVNVVDSLNRLRQVTLPGNITEKYTYDAVGNRKTVTAGIHNSATVYDYNPLGWLTRVQDPLYNTTEYWYDMNGNQVAQISPNQLKTVNTYDELNRLQVRKDSLGNLTKFSYDNAGNLWKMLDPRKTEWEYEYYSNNRPQNLILSGADGSSYSVSYLYDEAGNRTQVIDNGNTNHYDYDALSRLTEVERSFDGATYTTGYEYSNQRLSGILYPEAKDWLRYNYNSLNQVNEVVGFTLPNGITYDGDGAVKKITYQNGVTVGYGYDSGRRLMDLVATANGKELMNDHYQYWENSNNIQNINDKAYFYDDNNQLTKAITPGKFLEDKVTPGGAGVFPGDVLGTSSLSFGANQSAVVSVDMVSTSIGLDFGMVVPGVKKILFIPDQAHQVHRITEKTFDLFVSDDNLKYTMLGRSSWEYAKDGNGVITITLKERLVTRYLKIHVWYDNRDLLFVTQNKATFLNQLGKMLRVYQEATSREEEYQYDAVGNRILTKVTLVHAESNNSLYYANSDRLKTDGKFAFKYDKAGNLTEKGNMYSITGDTVSFTHTSGEGVEYWQYRYDLLNRLVNVKKYGTLISEYEYDPEGLRVVKKARGETVHYVFEGTEPIFERKMNSSNHEQVIYTRSYVYALGKHLARVDGEMDTYENLRTKGVPVYFYTTDHLGSIKAVTDRNGKTVFQADHTPFGRQYANKLDPGFEEDELGFTGKGYDKDIGLYYFNARWYDVDTGRFISEDPAMDPNNPNLYSYCGNNPYTFIDPTGLSHEKPYEGDPWEFEDLGGGTSDSGNSGNLPNYTSPWVPTMPNFQAPDAWEQYQNYWANYPQGYEWDRELCNQAIMVLNSGMDLWGLQALTPNNVNLRNTINLQKWNVSREQVLQVIQKVIHLQVNAMEKSDKGFVELPFNTPKDRNGFKEYQIFGLKYGQYGDMSNTFYWGAPYFIEKLMVSALYWNYQNEDSRIAFNDISYENGGKTATHSSHRDGIDVDLKIQWLNSVTGGYDDLNKISPGKKGYNLYIRGNTLYQTFGKKKNQEFIDMIRIFYPGIFKEILWCDWTLNGVSPSIKTNAKLRYDHRHHIHLGY